MKLFFEMKVRDQNLGLGLIAGYGDIEKNTAKSLSRVSAFAFLVVPNHVSFGLKRS